MIFPKEITDVHTHHLTDAEHQILALEPGDEVPEGARYISVGTHPWHADRGVGDEEWEEILKDSRLVAIGETGFDKLRGPGQDVQEKEFRRHVGFSERAGVPLVIHCVKAFDRVIALRRELQPRQPWIIHGFRGGAEQARQLVRHGFVLSFGSRYNQEAFEATPEESRLRETD